MSEVTALSFDVSELALAVPARFQHVIAHVTPEHLAYVDPEEALSYHELDRTSNVVASCLQAGVAQASAGRVTAPVLLFFAHNAASLVGILGTLKAGYHYVPLDPGLGDVAIRSALQTCKPWALVTESSLLATVERTFGLAPDLLVFCVDKLPISDTGSAAAPPLKPEDWAIVQYTSGSTGAPRGIIRTHGQLVDSAYQKHVDLGYSAADRVAHLLSFAIGFSGAPLFGALLNGATLCGQSVRDLAPRSLHEFLHKQRISALVAPVSVLRGLISLVTEERSGPLDALRSITTGGDAMTRSEIDALAQMLSPGAQIMVQLASTEAGVYARFIIEVGKPWVGERTPAGYTPPFTEVSILDENGQLVAPSTPGEIAVRSRFLAAGYWNEHELTAAKFLPDPAGGNERIFLTGDIGTMAADGLIEHLGRKDFMVKIRGYRIQLEEVEGALRALAAVRDAAVMAQTLSSGEKRLVAYVVAATQPPPTTNALRTALLQQLPNYMVPAMFVVLEKPLPMTATGKVDRQALPPPGRARPDLDTPFVAPRSDLEQQLADIWAELLELDTVGVEDNFFDLGGDSLMAMRMTIAVEQQAGQVVPSAFFRQPTIRHLSALPESDTAHLVLKTTAAIGPEKFDRKTQQSLSASQFPRHGHRRPFWRRRVTLGGVARRLRWPVESVIFSLTYDQAWSRLRQWCTVAMKIGVYSVELTLLDEMQASLGSRATLSQQHRLNYLIGNVLMEQWRQQWQHLTWTNRTSGTESILRGSTRPFWRDLGRIIENGSPDQIGRYYSFSGWEHLEQAASRGSGVILLSYHSPGLPFTNPVISCRLGCASIPTVARYGDNSTAEELVGVTAERTVRAYQQLRKGGVVHLANDNQSSGSALAGIVAGRHYHFKTGFAEMALSTGAAVIPKFSICRSDGRIHTTFLPAFQVDSDTCTPQEPIQSLVEQYAAFLEYGWRTMPESLGLAVIQRHLNRPIIATDALSIGEARGL